MQSVGILPCNFKSLGNSPAGREAKPNAKLKTRALRFSFFQSNERKYKVQIKNTKSFLVWFMSDRYKLP